MFVVSQQGVSAVSIQHPPRSLNNLSTCENVLLMGWPRNDDTIENNIPVDRDTFEQMQKLAHNFYVIFMLLLII